MGSPLTLISHKCAAQTHSPGPKNRVFSLQDIAPYHGRGGKHILVAVKHDVFDMTRGDDFYGPEGPYKCFSGGNASVALARMSLEQSDVDIGDTWDAEGVLPDADKSVLDEWYEQYEGKYIRLGPYVRNETEKVQALQDTWRRKYAVQGDVHYVAGFGLEQNLAANESRGAGQGSGGMFLEPLPVIAKKEQ